jgi:hypothetical protein
MNTPYVVNGILWVKENARRPEHQGLEAVLTGISMSAEKRGVVCDMRTCRNAKGGWCAILEEMRERSDDEGLERVL